MPDLPEITPEAIEAYWRVKLMLKDKKPIERHVVTQFLKAISPLFNDRNWPDLSMFDKLFIDKEDVEKDA